MSLRWKVHRNLLQFLHKKHPLFLPTIAMRCISVQQIIRSDIVKVDTGFAVDEFRLDAVVALFCKPLPYHLADTSLFKM